MRDNQPLCRFLTDSLGYNIDVGFENLLKADLCVSVNTPPSKFAYSERIVSHRAGMNYPDIKHVIGFSSTIFQQPVQMQNFTVGHEKAHGLIQAAVESTADSGYYGGDIETNWALEHNADFISIASNPENKYGLSPGARLISRAHRAGYLPDKFTKVFGEFAANRNLLVMKGLNHLPPVVARHTHQFFNSILDLSLSPTHPPDILRVGKNLDFCENVKPFHQKL